MTPTIVAALMFGVLFIALVVRIPVSFSLALACVAPLVLDPRLDLTVMISQMFTSFNSFLLLAVPFFLLAANLMNSGGITTRMFNWTRTMVGHLPGSLAQMNVILSMLFAGVSGSATADAASQSKIFINAQVKEGYGLTFSIAITAVSSILAVIIPPSILMIVWGGVFNTSINQLYMAGVLPGLLLTGTMMLIVYAYAKINKYPTYERATFMDFLRTGAIAIPAMVTPGIIVGGKLLGWFTATESGAIAVLYAIFLSSFIYREVGWKKFKSVLFESGSFAAISLFCLGAASVFGWLLAYYKIPQALVGFIASYDLGPVAIGFVVAGVFLLVGCFLDAIPAIIIIGTVLEPMVAHAGMDPVHFGIIGLVSLAFG
ncbi:MAG: TRAP transporter large permease, partial [Propionivibrio sp.]